jgi:7-cyano-7-deazaguanine synthase in queuosine biosynthesis
MILLASGGIDSYVAWHYLDKPPILFVNYGQPYYGIEYEAIKTLYPPEVISCVSLNGLPPLDRRKIHVPVRNLMLASLALRYSDDIALGGVKDEQCGDKSPSAFKQISALFSKQEGREITIYSPIWHFTKSQAVGDFVSKHGIEQLNKTVSCYSQELCNDCESCFRRFVALAVNGIIEPDRLPTQRIIKRFLNRLKVQPGNRAAEIITALKIIGYERIDDGIVSDVKYK